eukprot:Hpha_TRINITY_DN5757_c0_g1::TRINITY_DN5757_c0_g1_i1::g.147655::m.147655
MGESSADALQYRQIFRMIDRNNQQAVAVADIYEVISQCPSASDITIETFADWAGSDEVGDKEFAFLMAKVREICVVTSEKQISELNAVFLSEMFKCLDGNKDGRVTAAELTRFFDAINQRLQLPKPITSQQVEGYVRNADAPMGNKGFDKDTFVSDIMDQFFEDHREMPPALLLSHARRQLEERAQRKTAVGGLFGRIKETVQGPMTRRGTIAATSPKSMPKQHSFNPVPDKRMKSESSGVSSPDKGHGGSVSFARRGSPGELAESFKRQNTNTRGRSPSRANFGSVQLDAEDEWACQRAEMRETMDALAKRLKAKEGEVAQLRKQLRGDLESDDDSEDARLSPQELRAALASLRGRYDRLRESNEAAQEKVQLAQERVSQSVQQAGALSARVKQLEAVLAEEREKAKQLESIRAQQGEEDTRLRTQLRDLRRELKEKDDELSRVQGRLADAEEEASLARIHNASLASPGTTLLDSPRGNWRSQTFVTTDLGDMGRETDGPEIVFLNPRDKPELADIQHATLFNEPSPIYYAFDTEVMPTELHFDLCLLTLRACDYLCCRDANRRRSVNLCFDRGAVSAPPHPTSVPLGIDEWMPVVVVFNWRRRIFSVVVGAECAISEVPFRDKDVTGVKVFDVYPRRNANVAFANVRFVA